MKEKAVTRVLRRGPIWSMPFIFSSALIRYVRRSIDRTKWRMLGMRMVDGCHFGPGVRCKTPAAVSLGQRVVLSEGVRLASETGEGKLTIGNRVEVARGVMLDFVGDLTLEDDVLVSENAIIYTHDHGYDPRSRPTGTPLVLKQGCWIGARAIILPSVSEIGRNAIIGAGAIVSENVPDDHIYIASKGRMIKRKDASNPSTTGSAK